MESGTRAPPYDVQRVVVAAAIYTGPTYQLPLRHDLYLGMGGGMRHGFGAWRDDGDLNSFVELGLRASLSATYYLVPNVALVVELGVGAGWAFFMFADDAGAGGLFNYDAGFGVRWP